MNTTTRTENGRLKCIMATLMLLIISMTAGAQAHTQSRYYNERSGHLDYNRGRKNTYGNNYSLGRPYTPGNTYLGLRIGPAFSTVSSDDARLDGGSMKTGLNVGVFAGLPLSQDLPLFFETGLTYIEKGGEKKLTGSDKQTYKLNYLEVPLVVKYAIPVDGHFSIQPFFGGYLSAGVGGKVKNFADRESESSFSDRNFKRFDGGLRMGVGAGYDIFYAEIGYDLGLSNTIHDDFDAAHNGTLLLNFGVNF